MAFFCKGRREKYVSPFDQLAEYETAKLKEHQKKFNRLYKRNGLRGYDTIIVPLSEGIERADAILRILMRAYVDPTSKSSPPLSTVEWLEALDLIGVYGKNIVAFHDVLCSADVERTTACLKAWSLGWISNDAIRQAVADPSTASFNPEEVLTRIQGVIAGFGIK